MFLLLVAVVVAELVALGLLLLAQAGITHLARATATPSPKRQTERKAPRLFRALQRILMGRTATGSRQTRKVFVAFPANMDPEEEFEIHFRNAESWDVPEFSFENDARDIARVLCWNATPKWYEALADEVPRAAAYLSGDNLFREGAPETLGEFMDVDLRPKKQRIKKGK